MKLYKYVDLPGLLRILDGGIRFTQPGAFNDPFELLPEIYVPKGTPENEISIGFDLYSPRRSELEDCMPLNYERGFCNDIQSRDILRDLNTRVGIFCMSKNNDSLLMWSHYAAQYSGAVIEFDTDHDFFKGLIEVEYSKLRPQKSVNYYMESKLPIPIAELCVKSEVWAYESEYRIVRELKDCKRLGKHQGFDIYVNPVPVECIRSVCLGERSSVVEQLKIWGRLKDTNIALSLAAISNFGFDFRWDAIKGNSPIGSEVPAMTPRVAHIFKDEIGEYGEYARYIIKHHPLSQYANILA